MPCPVSRTMRLWPLQVDAQRAMGFRLWWRGVLGGVGPVVHHQELDVPNVVDEKGFVARGHHVARLFVGAVADLFPSLVSIQHSDNRMASCRRSSRCGIFRPHDGGGGGRRGG